MVNCPEMSCTYKVANPDALECLAILSLFYTYSMQEAERKMTERAIASSSRPCSSFGLQFATAPPRWNEKWMPNSGVKIHIYNSTGNGRWEEEEGVNITYI